jgi:alcohol dehydrogenase class IV
MLCLACPAHAAMSMQAVKLIFKYLPRAYKNGPSDPEARENVHNAATIAGMAFANAFLVSPAAFTCSGTFCHSSFSTLSHSS